MNALLFIQGKRKDIERIEFVHAMRLAMKGTKQGIEKAMEKWAKSAEINITFED